MVQQETGRQRCGYRQSTAASQLKIVRVDLMNNRLRMYKSCGKLVFG